MLLQIYHTGYNARVQFCLLYFKQKKSNLKKWHLWDECLNKKFVAYLNYYFVTFFTLSIIIIIIVPSFLQRYFPLLQCAYRNHEFFPPNYYYSKRSKLVKTKRHESFLSTAKFSTKEKTRQIVINFKKEMVLQLFVNR